MRRVASGAAILLAVIVALGGCTGPARDFAATPKPPIPDFRAPSAWLALPGDDGLARSTPDGIAPVDEARAPADVFFIHPTTAFATGVFNIPADRTTAFDRAVLANQASVFNGCCRIFAPRYRQAALGALGRVHAADDLALADVAAAFSNFLARIGDRPFIVAGHSQGASLGLLLVEERIAHTSLARRLVAAYLPGAFVPRDPEATIGLPACAGPNSISCIVAWNSSENDEGGAEMLLADATWRAGGAWRKEAGAPALCVDPLDWRIGGAASRASNPGSLPLRLRGGGLDANRRVVLPALVPDLTGAACRPGGALVVHVPNRAPPGFHDMLAWLTGSYHIEDYSLFWSAIRANADARAGMFAHGGLRP